MEGWLDGDAAYYVKRDVPDFSLKGLSENITMNSIFFSTFYGGSKDWFKPKQDVYAWFDEFTVSRSRIGYKGSTGGTTNPVATSVPTMVPTASATPKPVVSATPKPMVTPTPAPVVACQNVAWNVRTEIDLNKGSCVRFDRDLQGSTLQFWDSDLNASCDFFGNAASVDGAGSVAINATFVASSVVSGTMLKFTSAAGSQCKYIKVRAY